MIDTIFALSSGLPPAAIAIIRISGPQAGAALSLLAGPLPASRRASYRELRDGQGGALDRAMVIWLPGPATATGEDLAELHCHGGRAVVAAVEAALRRTPGLRAAEPGEFTRRAFSNGRIDLAEAEGLADLLSAETELQRRNAVSLAGGALSRMVDRWREELLAVSAIIEAALDFGDEDEVGHGAAGWSAQLSALAASLADHLALPSAELLRDGLRVVLAGPPNSGKSTLFNALVGAEAAITTPIAGTTRDVLTRPVALDGLPFVFVDTAGLREDAVDMVEAIGITRARQQMETGDIVLWLGAEGCGPHGAWEIETRSDAPDSEGKRMPRHRISAWTGTGMTALIDDLTRTARTLLPKAGDVALNRRQRDRLVQAHAALVDAGAETDLLLVSESLRVARLAFDHLLGRVGIEDVLDGVFGRFCIGK